MHGNNPDAIMRLTAAAPRCRWKSLDLPSAGAVLEFVPPLRASVSTGRSYNLSIHRSQTLPVDYLSKPGSHVRKVGNLVCSLIDAYIITVSLRLSKAAILNLTILTSSIRDIGTTHSPPNFR
jgi:hypothetical protein